MAEPAPPSKTHMPRKTVQELVLSGEEIPGNYIQKDRNGVDLDVPFAEIPVVNLTSFVDQQRRAGETSISSKLMGLLSGLTPYTKYYFFTIQHNPSY